MTCFLGWWYSHHKLLVTHLAFCELWCFVWCFIFSDSDKLFHVLLFYFCLSEDTVFIGNFIILSRGDFRIHLVYALFGVGACYV